MSEQTEIDGGTEEVYAVNPELVRSIDRALADGKEDEAREALLELRPGDAADVFEALPRDDRVRLVEALGEDLDPDVLTEVDGTVLQDILDAVGPQALAEDVQELDSDDAVYVLEHLEEPERDAVLRHVPAPDRAAVLEGLSFPEDSAGRLMQRDLIAVPAYWTVGQVIDYCRETDDLPDDFYEIFVIDPRFQPIGHVSLNRIMRTKRPVLMREIMEEDSTVISVDMDQEEVAFLFMQYRLSSAPVVDDSGRLVGAITFDDVAEVIEDETEEDMMRLSGVKGESDLFETAARTARSRSTWLFVNLITAILASVVIGFFDGTIEQVVALAILMPIVASMGGNAGTQTLTVAVRALATRELTAANAMRIVGKEVVVGGINGILFALLMGAVAAVWFSSPGIGMVIAAAMVVNMLIAGLAGMLIPIGLSRAGIDPAISATVFLTTVTDVVGFLAFLGLAALFLL